MSENRPDASGRMPPSAEQSAVRQENGLSSAASQGAPQIAAVGAGRMGRGIALAYALRGRRAAIVDFKPREPRAWQALRQDILSELALTLRQLAELGLTAAEPAEQVLGCIELCSLDDAPRVLDAAQIIFEGVPETLEAKRDALGRLGGMAAPDAIIASTTSTMLASDLAPMVGNPRRFMNAHWLNPAYIIPLVEVSAHPGTDPQAVACLRQSLESIGKVPVQCGCTPGYIVPRLQTLIMNEAARMVEENVATPEEIDRATRYGLGFRFAAIGVLEFIDYGGNDILYHANNYLAENLDASRYAMPDIVRRYMHEGRNGLRSADGFRSYEGVDLEAYRRDVLARALAMLRHIGLDHSAPINVAKNVAKGN